MQVFDILRFMSYNRYAVVFLPARYCILVSDSRRAISFSLRGKVLLQDDIGHSTFLSNPVFKKEAQSFYALQ
jgi:hypothetical protein